MHQRNPPAIAIKGKKTWDPSKSLHTFITVTFGLPLRDQVEIVEQIAAAMGIRRFRSPYRSALDGYMVAHQQPNSA